MITLTEQQIELLRRDELEGFVLVDDKEGGTTRWTRFITLIFRPTDDTKYYSVWYEEGLTECQEDYYEDQEAVEVKPVEVITKIWEVVE